MHHFARYLFTVRAGSADGFGFGSRATGDAPGCVRSPTAQAGGALLGAFLQALTRFSCHSSRVDFTPSVDVSPGDTRKNSAPPGGAVRVASFIDHANTDNTILSGIKALRARKRTEFADSRMQYQ
jgi:hypothetical protein